MFARLSVLLLSLPLFTACLDRIASQGEIPTGRSLRISEENLRTGSPGWDVGLPGGDSVTTGYVLPFSVQTGDTVHAFATSAGRPVRIQIYRLGWYSGAGARLVAQRLERSIAKQPGCTLALPGPSVCHWAEADRFAVGAEWTPGVYLAKFSDDKGEAAFYPFVVRWTAPTRFLAIMPFATYQAYNTWGGSSLYIGPGATRADAYANRAVKVSFARPYNGNQLAVAFLSVDYLLIRWLEQNSYDVSYISDYDLHIGRGVGEGSSAWLIMGHSEYWSSPMWKRAMAARDGGVNLGFLGGNDIYWMVRFEQDPSSGIEAPILVCYRDSARDPEGSVPGLATVQFRSPPNNSPENVLVGVMSAPPHDLVLHSPVDLVVTAPDNEPLLSGTGLRAGEHIGRVAGWEGDRIVDNGSTPLGIHVLFEVRFSPTVDSTTTAIFQSTYYRAPSGALVFAAGEPGFAWAMSSYREFTERPSLQRFFGNVMTSLDRPDLPR